MISWHFTTAPRLPWIIRSGYIQPGRHIRRNPDREGVTWFTTDGRKPDRTAAASGESDYFWIRLVIEI